MTRATTLRVLRGLLVSRRRELDARGGKSAEHEELRQLETEVRALSRAIEWISAEPYDWE